MDTAVIINRAESSLITRTEGDHGRDEVYNPPPKKKTPIKPLRQCVKVLDAVNPLNNLVSFVV